MTGGPHIVDDVMTSSVVSVDPETTFKEIVQVLQDHKVSAVPVVGPDGAVGGVVSEADLLPKEEFRDADPSRLGRLHRLEDLVRAGSVDASELMTTPAVTVESGATLSRAARIMARARVKQLPVVDPAGRMAGIVSRGDLLKVFLREDEDIAEEVRREIVIYLFPGEPSPVRVAVRDGEVTLSGRVRENSRVPVAARLVRAVEGVVDVQWDLEPPLRR
jgi:CBS domain-containing protein